MAGNKDIKKYGFGANPENINRTGANKGSKHKKTVLKMISSIPISSESKFISDLREAFPELFTKDQYTLEELYNMRLMIEAIAGKNPVPAAKEINDRIFGKAERNINATVTNGNLADMTDEEMQRLLDQYE